MGVEKTLYSLFTLNNKISEGGINIRLNGVKLTHDGHPKNLGVELDQRLTLNQYINTVIDKASTRLRLIKHLASCRWGADLQILHQLYVGYVRSVIDYSLPLQIIKGCYKYDVTKLCYTDWTRYKTKLYVS
jgi:hypothetical protein